MGPADPVALVERQPGVPEGEAASARAERPDVRDLGAADGRMVSCRIRVAAVLLRRYHRPGPGHDPVRERVAGSQPERGPPARAPVEERAALRRVVHGEDPLSAVQGDHFVVVRRDRFQPSVEARRQRHPPPGLARHLGIDLAPAHGERVLAVERLGRGAQVHAAGQEPARRRRPARRQRRRLIDAELLRLAHRAGGQRLAALLADALVDRRCDRVGPRRTRDGDPESSEDETRCQEPVNAASRFSTNAPTPSSKSSVRASSCWISASRSSCASRSP